ncbi:T9SS type A sorting domain-containing protein, partial [Candidatus Dojkabacteria bacterium]|nr:T9SS type A sorting domain-containing protein [Candidatus Dojkabacteria bacterium]
NGAEFLAPAAVTITANASDIDGSISKVEFFNGDNKLGEKISGPWLYIWNDVPIGFYSLTAVATDDLGAKTTSAPIYVKIDPEVTLYPNPNDGNFRLSLTEPLESGKCMIFIASTEGKVIYNGILLQNELDKEFHMSNLIPGVYIIKLYGDQAVFTTHFIKY